MTRVASASTAPGLGHVHGVVAKIGQLQILEQQAAVGMRVGAHPALASRRAVRQSRRRSRPVRVEELLGP